MLIFTLAGIKSEYNSRLHSRDFLLTDSHCVTYVVLLAEIASGTELLGGGSSVSCVFVPIGPRCSATVHGLRDSATGFLRKSF